MIDMYWDMIEGEYYIMMVNNYFGKDIDFVFAKYKGNAKVDQDTIEDLKCTENCKKCASGLAG